MFKAYQPPAPEQDDWIDNLINKGIPLAGAGLGAAGAIASGGLSLAAIPMIMGATTTGYGLGKTISGAVSNKPGSRAEMEHGMGLAAKGAATLNQIDPETGAFIDKERGTPQTGAPQTGLDAAKEKAKTAWYQSPYANRSA